MTVAIAACAPLTAYAALDAYLRINADPPNVADTAANGTGAIAIGAATRAGAPGSIAIGWHAEATNAGSIALGTTAAALGTRAIAVGDGALAQRLASSAFGVGAQATGHDASAFGGSAHAEGEESTALGNFAYAAGEGSVALGIGATTGDDHAIAIGPYAAAHLNGSIAIGSGTAVFNDKSVAIGYGSVADSDLSTSAYTYTPGVNMRAIAAAVPFGEVSVGYPGEERRITHVAAGAADTDAVNISQLKAVDQRVQENHTAISNIANGNGDGRLPDTVVYAPRSNQSRVVFSGANGTLLTNVGDGAITAGSRDAINGGQIAALRDDLQNRITGIDRRVGKFDGTVTTPTDSGSGSEPSPSVPANSGHPGDKDSNAAGTSAAGTGYHTAADDADTVASATSGAAVGQGASAAASATGAVAPGEGSVADHADTVPAGSPTQPRAIAAVMAGAPAPDAVNVRQLDSVKSQMAGIQQSIDNLRGQVNQRFDQLNSRMNRLGAMNAAMSTMAASTAGLRTENSVAIGTGLYRGQSALAIGYQRRIAGRMAVTVSGSTAGSSEYSVGMGAGYGW